MLLKQHKDQHAYKSLIVSTLHTQQLSFEAPAPNQKALPSDMEKRNMKTISIQD